MVLHLIGEHLLLDLVAMLEEFLNHVITEYIGHKLPCIGMKLLKNLLLLVAISLLKLLLYET